MALMTFRKTGALLLLVCLLALGIGASALEPAKLNLENVWYRDLGEPTSSFPNSHYRYSIYSFYRLPNGDTQAYNAEFHPDQATRTMLRIGVLHGLAGNGTGYQANFHQTQLAQAIRLGKAVGWPIASLIKMDGLVSREADIPLELNQGANAGELSINGQSYRPLKDDLVKLALAGDNEQNASEFLRLSFISVMLFQLRVAGYGTSKMLWIDETVKGMAAGYLRMVFRSRGFLGLGNSGVQFMMLDDASDIPGLAVSGDIFAGVASTEGILSFYEVADGVHTLLGTLDFSRVKTVDAVGVGGSIGVRLAAGAAVQSVHWVSYAVLPN